MLARHATSILNTEYDRVFYFIRRLKLPINMSTQSLVIVDRCYVEVLDHSRVIEEIYYKGCEGCDKRNRF